MCMCGIAKDIAEQANNIAKGLVWYCPDCGAEHTTAVECPVCKECGRELEQLTMLDWLDDSWYNDRVTTSTGDPDTVIDGSVMVAFGGPNVWVNTEGFVEAYSWGDHETAPLDTGACDEIREALQMVWDSRRA